MTGLTIGGTTVPPRSLSFSQLGMGRYLRRGEAPFILTADAQDFFSRFAPTYESGIAELVRDDEITGGFAPPFAGAKHYPSLEALFRLPEAQRVEMVDTFFKYEILGLYLGEDDSSAEWAANSMDSLRLEAGSLLIGGQAVPWPPNV